MCSLYVESGNRLLLLKGIGLFSEQVRFRVALRSTVFIQQKPADAVASALLTVRFKIIRYPCVAANPRQTQYALKGVKLRSGRM
jgi:hypothetical protein